MQTTWNNGHAPSFDIVDAARRLAADVISRLKAATAVDPMQAVVELTAQQQNELDMLACWN